MRRSGERRDSFALGHPFERSPAIKREHLTYQGVVFGNKDDRVGDLFGANKAPDLCCARRVLCRGRSQSW
jgi:hypothetical protein